MKSKSFTKKAVCVAVLSCVAVGANAAVTVLPTPVPGGPPVSFSGGALGNSVSFGDLFMFDLLPNGGSGYSVAEFVIPGFGDAFHSVLTNLTLWSNPDNSAGFGTGSGGLDEVLKGQQAIAGPALSFLMGPLAPGHYLLGVNGFTSGTVGGGYSGSIGVAAPPVPEPESYAMFLAGLGLMGVIVRRRMRRQ